MEKSIKRNCGYDPDRFEKLDDENFICLICTQVYKNPVVCGGQKCAKVYCK